MKTHNDARPPSRARAAKKRIFAVSLTAALVAPIGFATPAQSHGIDHAETASSASSKSSNVNTSVSANPGVVTLLESRTVTIKVSSGKNSKPKGTIKIFEPVNGPEVYSGAYTGSDLSLSSNIFKTQGTHTINFVGDTGFNSSTTTIRVQGTETKFRVGDEDVIYGNPATIRATSSNPKIPSGSVALTVSNLDVTIPDSTHVDGLSVFSIPGTPEVGAYPFEATLNSPFLKKADSARGTLEVKKASTETTVSPNSIELGEDIFVTVRAKNSPAIPTGTVTLLSSAGNSTFATATLSGGTATFSQSEVPASGKYLVRYERTKNFDGSSDRLEVSSAPKAKVDVRDATTVYETPGTITATYTPTKTTGMMTLFINDEEVAREQVSGGSATFDIAGTGYNVGTHKVRVQFAPKRGDEVSRAASYSVTKADSAINPTLTLGAGNDANTLVVGVAGASSGTAIPDGQVTLSGQGPSQSFNVSNGSVTIPSANIDLAGEYQLTFSGATNYNDSSATITVAPRSSSITASAISISYGDTASLNPVVNPEGVTGIVTVSLTNNDGGAPLANTKNLVNGATGTFEFPGLNAGSYSATIKYDGDSRYASATKTVDVNVAKLPTTLASDQNVIQVGQSDIVVTVSAKSQTPDGLVALTDESGMLIGSFPLSGGSVTIPAVNFAATGEYTISYAGSSNFEAATPISVTAQLISHDISLQGDSIVYALESGQVVVSGFARSTSGTASITLIGSDGTELNGGTAQISEGSATFNYYGTQFPVDVYSIRVKYASDGVHASVEYTSEGIYYSVASVPTGLTGSHLPNQSTGQLTFDVSSPAPHASLGGSIDWIVTADGTRVDGGTINVPGNNYPTAVAMRSSFAMTQTATGSLIPDLLSANLVVLAPGEYHFTGIYTADDRNFGQSSAGGTFVVVGPEDPTPTAPPTSGVGPGDISTGGTPVQCTGTLVNNVCVLGDTVSSPTLPGDTTNVTSGKTASVKGDTVAAKDTALAVTGTSVTGLGVAVLFLLLAGSGLVIRRKVARS